jgi:putative aldouronate transport system permease protein
MTVIKSSGEKAFTAFNYIFLTMVAASCVLPFVNVIAISLSKNAAVAANYVKLWPVQFTPYAYQYVVTKQAFWTAFYLSLKRVLRGLGINMALIVLTAYPLSKEVIYFKARTLYVWVFFFTLLFSGGFIPMYALVNQLKLLGTIWALILPGALPVFNMILMLNFFRQIPRELEEAAFIDGADHFKVLFLIFLPCSLPSIATMALFTIVAHWNAWFDGLIFMRSSEGYPLQSYLQTVIIGLDFSKTSSISGNYSYLKFLSDRTLKAAQIVIAVIPVLMIYPFLQKYFVSGIVLGSVKG